jgi:hypothetical protein
VALHPQCATKLLKECVCAAPAYLAQVCHPNFTKEFFEVFDEKVWQIFLEVLGGVSGPQLHCCEEGLARARTRAFLPTCYRGVGLRSWSRVSEFSWFCSVASCIGLDDRDFEFGRPFLGTEGQNAYEFAVDSLGGESYLAKSARELIPAESDVLTGSNFYKDFFHNSPKVKYNMNFFPLSMRMSLRDFLLIPIINM